MRKSRVIVGVVLALMIGGLLLYAQFPSGPTGIGEFPGMLYFYAKW